MDAMRSGAPVFRLVIRFCSVEPTESGAVAQRPMPGLMSQPLDMAVGFPMVGRPILSGRVHEPVLGVTHPYSSVWRRNVMLVLDFLFSHFGCGIWRETRRRGGWNSEFRARLRVFPAFVLPVVLRPVGALTERISRLLGPITPVVCYPFFLMPSTATIGESRKLCPFTFTILERFSSWSCFVVSRSAINC